MQNETIPSLHDLVAAETKADLSKDLVNSIPEIVKSAIDVQYEHANEVQKKVLDEMRAQDPYEIVSESVKVYDKHLGLV